MPLCECKERQSMQKFNWATYISLILPCYHSVSDYRRILLTLWCFYPLAIILMAGANPNVCFYFMPSLTILQKSGCFSPLWDGLVEQVSVWSRKCPCLHSFCFSCPGSPSWCILNEVIYLVGDVFLRELRQIETFLHLPFRYKSYREEILGYNIICMWLRGRKI